MLTPLFVLVHAEHDGVVRRLLREVDAAYLTHLRLLVDEAKRIGAVHGLKEPEPSFHDPEEQIHQDRHALRCVT